MSNMMRKVPGGNWVVDFEAPDTIEHLRAKLSAAEYERRDLKRCIEELAAERDSLLPREREFKLAYMAHPLGGNVESNLAWAKDRLWELRETYEETHNIIAPWMSEAEQFDDSDPEQRARGLAKCFDIIGSCDELWLCGPMISSGMQQERSFAEAQGITVLDLTDGD